MLHLPPYSSDYNPLEETRSRFNQRNRRARARTVARPDDAPTEVSQAITPKDLEEWFRHSDLDGAGWRAALEA